MGFNQTEFDVVWTKIQAGINWHKILFVMQTVKWTWAHATTETQIPSVEDIKAQARRFIIELMQMPRSGSSLSKSGGGVKVTRFMRPLKRDGYKVEFILEYADAFCGMDEFTDGK